MQQEKKMYQRPELSCRGRIEEITLNRRNRPEEITPIEKRRQDREHPGRKRGRKHVS
jgi:hypothetical protein